MIRPEARSKFRTKGSEGGTTGATEWKSLARRRMISPLGTEADGCGLPRPFSFLSLLFRAYATSYKGMLQLQGLCEGPEE